MLKLYGWSQSDLCGKIEENGIYTDQNSISNYLPKNTNPRHMSYGLVLQCCKLFHVSFEDLASPFFEPEKYYQALTAADDPLVILPDPLKSVTASSAVWRIKI